MSAPNYCERCDLHYHYAPSAHKCPDVWSEECAADGAADVVDPFAGMSWADECVAKVRQR